MQVSPTVKSYRKRPSPCRRYLTVNFEWGAALADTCSIDEAPLNRAFVRPLSLLWRLSRNNENGRFRVPSDWRTAIASHHPLLQVPLSANLYNLRFRFNCPRLFLRYRLSCLKLP
jgi:hypothetical protein